MDVETFPELSLCPDVTMTSALGEEQTGPTYGAKSH